MTEPLRSGWRWLPLSVVLIVADQWTKGLVEARFVLGESLPVWFWFDLTRLHNAGAAFSFLAGAAGWQRLFFSTIAVIAAVWIVVLLRRHAHETLFCLALSLILGGALGNLISGAVLVETVFSWPGLGKLIIDSIQSLDRPKLADALKAEMEKAQKEQQAAMAKNKALNEAFNAETLKKVDNAEAGEN